MTRTTRLTAVAITFTLTACGADVDAPDDPTGPTVELTANLSGIISDENNDVVPGVTVCVHEREEIPCVTSDERGHYTLPLPEEDLVIRYSKDGFVPKLAMFRAEGEQFTTWVFQREGYYADQEERVGVDWDHNLGIVTIQPGPGMTIMLDPQAGDGPFYADNALDLDPDMTKTGDFGVGVFINVPPGLYHVGAFKEMGSGVTCEPIAWDDDGAGGIVVVAGEVSWAGLRCVKSSD